MEEEGRVFLVGPGPTCSLVFMVKISMRSWESLAENLLLQNGHEDYRIIGPYCKKSKLAEIKMSRQQTSVEFLFTES